MLKQSDSSFIYALRGIAIISVICAHSGYVGKSASSIDLQLSYFLGTFGSVGVGLFFLLSGYMMGYSSSTKKDFLTKKIKTMIPPWFISASIVYLYVVLRRGEISIISWLNFVLGNGSYLYFMSMLFVLYWLYIYIHNRPAFVSITIAISIVSNIITALFPQAILDCHLTPFIIPFNWMIYFGIGIMIFHYNAFNYIRNISSRGLPILFLSTVVIFVCYGILGRSLYYFELFFIPIELLLIVFIIGITDKLNSWMISHLSLYGKQSLSIYLYHMLMVGIVVKMSNESGLWLTILFRPILIIWATSFLLKKLKKLLDMHAMSSLSEIILGYR